MSKRLLFMIGLVAALLAALAGFALFLFGAPGAQKAPVQEQEPPTGIVHLKSILVDGEGTNLYRPTGLSASSDGRFVVTLRDTQKVMLFGNDGSWIRTWGERGMAPGNMLAPLGVALDGTDGRVYVTDRSRLRLIAFSDEGKYLWEVPLLNPLTPVITSDGIIVTTFGPIAKLTKQGELVEEVGSRGPDLGQFDYARGIATVGSDGLIVADSNNTRVQRVKFSGSTTATVDWFVGTPPKKQDDPDTVFGMPSSVALDDRGRAYVLDGFRHQIVVLDPEDGKEIASFDGLDGETDGRFNMPTSIAYLGGNRFAITDTYNDRVQIVRIVLPDEDSIIARNPSVLWGLVLLLLPAPLIWGKKQWFATESALDKATAESRLRLVASVARRVQVTPEVAERYASASEAGIELGEYFRAVGRSGPSDTQKERLLDALPVGAARLLLPRVRLVVADEAEAERYDGRGRAVITLEQLASEFRLEGDGGPAPEKAPDAATENA